MPTPLPHQIEGARFLADRSAALLADEPRCGKTGCAIMACDFIYALKILVVTTATARAQWGREFRIWGDIGRSVQVIYSASENVRSDADVVIVSWSMVHVLTALRETAWAVVILDESHYAKSPEAKRTQAVYGRAVEQGIVRHADHVWCLTGTPIPNAPNDLWPMLNALAPERIEGLGYTKFMHRYCVVRKKYVGGQWIEYAIKGKNEDELAKRLEGFWLRRTQADVGIGQPIYSIMPIHVDGAVGAGVDEAAVLAAAEAGETARLEMELGTLRRVTGAVMAPGIVEAAKEALENGLDRLVIMYWHKEVGHILRDGLSKFGVVLIDGATENTKRDGIVEQFKDGKARVFLGQIIAAGEAIDLSASAELWFAESSFVPAHMRQASLRITNYSQTRTPLVRVCALEGSFTETLAEILTRKWTSITQIQEN